jgi:hypothetical protein
MGCQGTVVNCDGVGPCFCQQPALTGKPYDAELMCRGCAIRNENIICLLEGILRVAKHFGVVREDLTFEEFNGPNALQLLRDIEKYPFIGLLK